VYSTGKTTEADRHRHGFLARLVADLDPAGREKVIYFLADASPEKLIAEFPIKAVVLPRKGGDVAHVARIPSGRAITVCAPDTTMLLPDAGPEVLFALAQVVRSVPCFELWLGPDPKRIPDVLANLLAGSDVCPP
jgi:hypothetical protein